MGNIMRFGLSIMTFALCSICGAQESLYRSAPLEIQQSESCREHLVQRAVAAYPKKAMLKGLSGYVVLTYDLDGSGKAQGIVVADSQPSDIFNSSAIDALQRSAFKSDVKSIGCRYVVDFTAVRRRQ